ncbi:MAG: 30S ribosomal protein S4e [Thermoplasmatota archaeon]
MSLHVKRLSAPRSWHIARKTGGVFIAKPTPGAHAMETSLPLGVALRDSLKICGTLGEASRIVHQRDVLIDGKVAQSVKQPVGLMDLVQIPKLEQGYRVLLDRHGRITFVPVPEQGFKLARIENKTTVAGGKVQLNLHDGRNVLVKEDAYHSGDSLKIKLPEQKILAHYKLAPGATAVIIGGKHSGEVVKVKEVEQKRSPAPNLVHVAAGSDEFATIKPYVFVVGTDKPEMTLAGGM